MVSKDAFIAVNRFGLGPQPLELGVIGKKPRDWLKRQIITDQKTPSFLSSSNFQYLHVVEFQALATSCLMTDGVGYDCTVSARY